MILSESQQITLIETPIKLAFEGKLIELKKPVCRDINRLYLPLTAFIRQIKGCIILLGQIYALFLPNRSAFYAGRLNKNYKTAIYNNTLYISLFDLCSLLDLKTVWNYDSESILLYRNREKPSLGTPSIYQRPALIRFEDVTAGGDYLDSNNLERFRVMADFLYSSGITFHIAWISRFIDPPNGIDNDISKDYSMPNANFLFTLEYLLQKGGIIGLHGYTHQYGEEVSGDGTEFSWNRNHNLNSIKERVEAAMTLASRLSIPYKFFESPHYASTPYQQGIFERYFDIIYEPCAGIWGNKVIKSPRNHHTIYVPTPLGYLEGENALEKMIKRIQKIKDTSLASLFYHPYAEFEYITINTTGDGYPTYDYKIDSPLHQMIDALYEKNCRFVKVTDLLY